MTMPENDRYLRFLAPAILIVVAAVQITLAKTQQLTPWKGGGFGMFSTVDDPSSRWLRAFAVVGGRRVSIPIPERYSSRAARIGAMPSRALLHALAADLASERFVTAAYERRVDAEKRRKAGLASVNEPACPAETSTPSALAIWDQDDPRPAANEVAAVERVRVELWHYRFDLPHKTVIASTLAASEATP
jgi:hypothetical protein